MNNKSKLQPKVPLALKKKWKVMVLIALLLITNLIISGAHAYLIDSDGAVNELVGGSVDAGIVETFDPPEDIEPGISFTKDVKVENRGLSYCYVRVKAVFENSHMEQYCDIDWNNNDWTYNSQDGYWYYTQIVSPSQSTTSLFTTVSIKSTAPTTDVKNFHIIVYSESVEAHQGQGFTSYAQAWEHYQKNKSANKATN